MPKIPLSQRAGAIQHVRTAAPINAGGQTLKYYGGDGTAEAFAKAGERIGSGLEKLGHSMLQFARQTQDVENNLAAAEDRALYNERSNALLKQLVSNPGASEEEKNKWIKDFEENYAVDRKEITKRMSTAYRTQHDVEMTSLAKTFAAKRSLAIRESSVTGQLNRAMDLYKRSCESGDFEEAKRILHDNKGTLFSEEQVKHFTEHDLPMRQDFFDAKQLAESDPRTALAAALLEQRMSAAGHLRHAQRLLRALFVVGGYIAPILRDHAVADAADPLAEGMVPEEHIAKVKVCAGRAFGPHEGVDPGFVRQRDGM